MKEMILIFFFIVLIPNHNQLQACSCEWQGPFLTVAKVSPLVAVVKIKKYLLFSGNMPLSMEVDIIELIKGDSSLKTVKVWGDTGILCRTYLGNFQSDSIWVLSLFKCSDTGIFRHPDEKVGDYFISVCGTFYLSVKNDIVSGLIQNVNYNDPAQTMNLNSFIATAKEVLTSIKKEEIPYSFEISQNYPNPFNPETKISFTLKEDCKVKLIVYNMLGELIAVLVDELKQRGKYTVVFNSSTFPSGCYFYRIQAGNKYQAARKMILLR